MTFKKIDYKAILEGLPGLYLILDKNFTIIEASDLYLKATLATRDKVIGVCMFTAFPDDPDDENATGVVNLKRSLLTVLSTKKPNAMAIQKYSVEKHEGGYETRYWSPLNYPLLDESGNVLYIIHRAEDVTEYINLKRSKFEQLNIMEKLQSKAGKMEIEIYQRAQEIQEVNEKLKTANAHLSMQDEIKNKFLANISHELRTPLMLILGPLDGIMKDPLLPKKYLSKLKVIAQNSRILLKHVNDLLDLAKLQAGKMKFYYTRFDLVALINQLLALFAESISKKHLQIIKKIPKKCEIEGDAEKIQRIFLNLFSNAIKFTPEKGTIHLRISRNKNLKFIIEDNGIGIPKQLRPYIFERFYQVEKSSTKSLGSTGLGLAIVKDFVELHKGQISVKKSSLGGACFIMTLPLTAPAGVEVNAESTSTFFQDDAIIELEKNKPVSGPQRLPRQSHKNIILIVEDNPDLNAHVSELLNDKYCIENAFNGEEGLAKVKLFHPDLIITDMMMPKMDGATMVREIRKNATLLPIPIMVLTAKADDKTCIAMLREGAQDYMIKPFSPEIFKARVDSLIAAKKAGDELERFVYLASHDLKSPLPAIDHLAAWIEEDKDTQLSEQSKHYLYKLRKRATRMSKLLDGLLKYSQVTNTTSLPEKIELKPFIDTIISLISNSNKFEFIFKLKIKHIITCSAPFREVLAILIDNSIKHHNAHHGLITIGGKEKKNHYEFYVADDGPGINPKYNTKIFELFQRLQSRDVLDTSGVGLSIAKKIIEKIGGRIWVESEMMKGATFKFIWPKECGEKNE